MLILGIETSCDETSVAVVESGRKVRSNAVYSQIAAHRPYGGVVPEIASRKHVEVLPHVMREALETANCKLSDLDGIAVTYGPGLASSLLVGLSAAKALAMRLDKPLYPVNHLHGHLFSVYLAEDAPSAEEAGKMLVLLVSGGHTCLVLVDGPRNVELLGQTLDDAAGEALDKGAKLMGLGYPGGPEIEKHAEGGDPTFVDLPAGARIRSTRMTGGLNPEFCFSYSGAKTALLYYLQKNKDHVSNGHLKDVCASYQRVVFGALIDRAQAAINQTRPQYFACVGGVARNKNLRLRLEELTSRNDLNLILTPFEYCTDNAAMIAGVAGSPGWRPELAPLNLDVSPSLPVNAWGDL